MRLIRIGKPPFKVSEKDWEKLVKRFYNFSIPATAPEIPCALCKKYTISLNPSKGCSKCPADYCLSRIEHEFSGGSGSFLGLARKIYLRLKSARRVK